MTTSHWLSFNFSMATAPKHRGFAFVTFSSSADAQDAIDNMDMNELKGRVLKVNLARPMKASLNPQGNRAGAFLTLLCAAVNRTDEFSALLIFF